MVSRQPRLPQWHLWPSGSTVMCPISPVVPSAPRHSRPLRISPPPTPVPRVIPSIWSWPAPAPSQCSPRAKRLASFSRNRGQFTRKRQMVDQAAVIQSRHVGGKVHPAFPGQNPPGDPDTPSLDLPTALPGGCVGLGEVSRQGRHQGRLIGHGGRGPFPPGENLSLEAHQSQADIGAPQSTPTTAGSFMSPPFRKSL